jgi:hypothetical protein
VESVGLEALAGRRHSGQFNMIQTGKLLEGHHPPHLFLENTWYAVTANTVAGEFLLHSWEAKILVRDTLKQLILNYQIKLQAWVITITCYSNHHTGTGYHV